jgi:hypothetical protein
MHLKIAVAGVIVSIILSSVRFYHDRYIFRSKENNRAKLYLQSDVCSDNKLRVQLGKYQECSAAEYELAISPSTRALYDLLEVYTLCGSKQRRCEALVFWFQENKYVIFGFSAFLLYVGYQWFLNERQMYHLNRYMNQHLLPVT